MTNTTRAQAPLPAIAALIADKWWVLLLRGLLLIALGLYMLLQPGLSLLAYALVLGVFLIADGALAVIAGVAGWGESRGWTIGRGLLMLLVGAVIVWRPLLFGAIAGVTLVIFIALAAIAGGVGEIIVAVRERKAIQGEGWMMLSGALSILFGIVLICAPLLSLALLISFSGIVAIVFGAIVTYGAFRLRRLKSNAAR